MKVQVYYKYHKHASLKVDTYIRNSSEENYIFGKNAAFLGQFFVIITWNLILEIVFYQLAK